MPVLGSPDCEWLLLLAVFQGYWWCLFLAPQLVGGCSGLLCFKCTDDACAWLSRMWVATVACCVSYELRMPVLGTSGSEWLQWLGMFQAYWWCLSWVLQVVSGCSGLLYFEPTDDACPWLFRMWVAVLSCHRLSLRSPVLGFSGSVLLWCLTVFYSHWWLSWLSSLWVATLLCLKPADHACPCLFRELVTWLICYDSSSLTPPLLPFQACEWLQCTVCWWYLPFAVQFVSGCSGLLYFEIVVDSSPWLIRKWVVGFLHFKACW